MFCRRISFLRFPEGEQGAGGAEGTGAAGAGQPAAEPEGEDKSINSQAKKLPWVQNALAAEARLKKLESEQAEAKRKAEQTALEQKGQYEQALKMEKDGRAADKAAHDSEIKRLTLKAELAQSGFRPESLKLFIDEYKPEEGPVEQFVAKLKKDAANSWLLVEDTTKKRTPNPAKPSGQGPPEEFDPSWIDSDDPKKREAAVVHNRNAFWAQYHAKSGGGSR